MEKSTKDLRNQITNLEDELTRAKGTLNYTERRCDHVWGEAAYTPDYQESYTTPGDPPGTMGIDWRGPSFIPSTNTPKWTRICQTCGKKETTTRTNETVTKTPKF